MKTRYNAILEDGTVGNEQPMDIDQLVDYKIACLKHGVKFTIEEVSESGKSKKVSISRPKKEKKSPEDTDQTRNEFKRTLSDAQREDVRLGNKQIKYSTTIGYFLKVIHKGDGSAHSSAQANNFHKKVEIKAKLKSDIMSMMVDVINGDNYEGYPDGLVQECLNEMIK